MPLCDSSTPPASYRKHIAGVNILFRFLFKFLRKCTSASFRLNSCGAQPVNMYATHRDLKAETQRVMHEARAACAALLAVLPGSHGAPQIRSASDLQRALGIRATVAWQLYRLAKASDPLREIDTVPGPVAVKRMIEAGRKRGVSAALLAQLQSAVEAVDAFARTHAGSRKALHSMITSLGTGADDAINLLLRRAAFRANSQIWGLQARACLWSTTYFPGDSSDRICAMSLRGPIGVKRLRIDATYIVSGYIAFEQETETPQAEPLGTQVDGDSPDPRLLVPFCTTPLPRVSTTLSDGNRVVTEMPPGLMGNQTASTIILADVTRGSRWRHDEEQPSIVNSMGVATPFEVLVIDTLFHREMFRRLTPRPRVFGRHALPLGIKPQVYTAADTIPMAVHASYLGCGPACMETADIPRYGEMYEHACAKAGLDPTEFDVYRCTVEYPILHAHVGVWFDLPQQGNW